MTNTYKFKLLTGVHAEAGKVYRKGDIIETSSDLLKLNDPQSPRFESLDDVVETKESVDQDLDGLDEMTYTELKNYAKEGGIEVSGATTKAKLIKLIREA